ncbi:hypothetical protein E8E13_002525 [Curvularia kusanoi]|uniref:NACHT domain-containing protein n=1 Tax=Curvularia kusanoi TaxID=90978 RepID=A0A9P4WA96_CURKU|nr:hypothetical protein E8E13_002525 [Curvularia kusanoi]
MSAGTESLFQSLTISDTTATNGAQSFNGLVLGNVTYGNRNKQSSDRAAKACRDELFLTDPKVVRDSVINSKGERAEGTCKWITRDAAYRKWLGNVVDEDSRLLWISGGPGKGKTMLSVFLTEELEKHTNKREDVDIIFFFCDAQDEKRNTALVVLRGIIYQILEKRPQLSKHAVPSFGSSKKPEKTHQTLTSLEALWLIFKRLIADEEFGTFLCVLDGLDECVKDGRKFLLRKLTALLTTSNEHNSIGDFRLAIVSRDDLDLQAWPRIRLDTEHQENIHRDIKTLVTARTRELYPIEGFQKIKRSVRKKLLDLADGTFLWVGFAMLELQQKITCTEILEALDEMPSGLTAIYNRMLLQIPHNKRTVSRKILQWVTCAVRPLNMKELAAAIEIQAVSTDMTILEATRDAIRLCGALLKVEDQQITLVHQSARDYLLRNETDSDAVLEVFRLDLRKAHWEMAKKCLDCVSRSVLKYREVKLNAETQRGESALLRYSMMFWPEHARGCDSLAEGLLQTVGLPLRKAPSWRNRWWNSYQKGWWNRKDPPPLLHMACFLGIKPWVNVILAQENWKRGLEERDDEEATALHWAAYHGNVEIVRLLLEAGADIEAETEDNGTALHIAAHEDHEDVVRLLLEEGASRCIEVEDCGHKTALDVAIFEGSVASVRLLIEEGAEVKDDQLFFPGCWRNEEIAQLLLEHGADVNAENSDGDSVLQDAVFYSKTNKEFLKLLMDQGADVEAEGSDGWTPLHYAVSGGNVVAVRLLLAKDVDIEAKTDEERTPLFLAILEDKRKIARMLIDQGASIDALKDKGRSSTAYKRCLELLD